MSAIPSSGDADKTTIEKLNENDEVLEAMLSMPRRMNEQMVQSRRSELFAVLWEETNMSEREVLMNVEDREDDFISKYGADEGEPLPEWLLRMEAQDILLKAMCEEMGIIEETV